LPAISQNSGRAKIGANRKIVVRKNQLREKFLGSKIRLVGANEILQRKVFQETTLGKVCKMFAERKV
jgi:hypothetical protein